MNYDIEKVKTWLKQNKRSQSWLAEQVGVHTGTVNRWLQGHLQPTASKIILLDRIMGGGAGIGAPPPPPQEVRLKLPEEVWGLVEQLARVQGMTAGEYVHKCAEQLAEELACLLIDANERRQNNEKQ